MIRHTARALCAATLVIAPLALTATPAHAVTSCTVNGSPRTPDPMTHTIFGTAGSDNIRCTTVDAGDTVNGLGGNDYIVVSGAVNGDVAGGDGSDYIVTGTVFGAVAGGNGSDYIQTGAVAGGLVTGEAGNDVLRTGGNMGVVDGGIGWDSCRTAGGAPPVNCEG
ncbi:hypothetical protein [Streptomyces tritici]|uniref:hypothetical protein n=1 Tax=Streptomyces tritici TaxID=2054410 RepID=UPI003AF1070C